MAYTNNNGQSRVGVRIVPLSVVIPTISTLLDSYSGAAAAYSLRKLKSSYTGSAIRVRRSSDNTEQNIGFDSNGNLDTYSLSAFVGTGNGFVSIWYDQSGSYNLIQTTAANQPSIVLSGAINTQNNKPILITDFNSYMSNSSLPINGTTNSIFATIKMVTTRGNISIMSGYNLAYNPHFVSRNTNGNNRYYDSNSDITASPLPNGLNLINLHENSSGITVYENGSNLVTNFSHDLNNTTGISIFRWSVNDNSYMPNGSGFAELIVYGNSSKLSDNSAISNNINTYYSVYPNPTSVWNLLNAVYSADTTALPSLKTSLVAAYNGESNTNDSFGTNNGTAVGGLTYGTGKIGNAFVGNGTTSYIEVGDKFDLGLSSWSYNIWFYPTNLSFNRTLFSKTAWAAGGGRFALNIESALITFNLTLSDGNYITIRDNSTILPGSQWSNLTVVVDRNDKIKLYYNGVLSTNVVNLGSVNNNLIPYINDNLNNTRSFRIGCGSGTDGYNPETPTRFAQGSIDSFNVWNRALTQAEIIELYNSGNGAQYIGDNFYKPTVNDALGTNNGTAVGGLTYGLGKVGTAFQFNGTNASVRFPANSMNFTGDFSISVWVNIPSGYIGSSEIDLLTNITMPYWYNSPKGFWFRTVGAALYFSLSNGTTSDGVVWNDTQGLIIKGNSGWINIVATRKSSTRSNLYVNGVLKASNTSTFNPAYSLTNQTPASGALHIVNSAGVVQQNSVFAPNGTKIDGLSVWNKELTQADVTELYNSGNGKQYPN